MKGDSQQQREKEKSSFIASPWEEGVNNPWQRKEGLCFVNRKGEAD